MRKKIWLTGFLSVLFSQILVAGYQYRALPLDGGGAVNAVVGSPHSRSIVLACTDMGGIHRSTDGGSSWVISNEGLTGQWDFNTTDAAFAPSNSNRVYFVAGTSYSSGYSTGHVFVSDNCGQTWTRKNGTTLSIGGQYGIRQRGKIIVVDPTDADHLWVGNCYTDHGVMESFDAGDTFTPVGPTNIGAIYVLMADPANSSILYAGAGADTVNGKTGENGLWKSTDSGQNWTKVYSTRVTDMDISSNGRIVVIGGDKNGVMSSTDGGENWAAFNTGLPANGSTTYDWTSIAADPDAPERFIISSHTNEPFVHPKMFVRENGSAAWVAVDSDLGSMFTTYGVPGVDGWQGLAHHFAAWSSQIEFHPAAPDQVYVSGWYTVEVSQDGGQTWEAQNSGLRSTVGTNAVWDAFEPNHVYMGVLDVGAHEAWVNIKNDGGQMSVHSLYNSVGMSNTYCRQFEYSGDVITLVYCNNGIYRRVNHDTWTNVALASCGSPTATVSFSIGSHPTSGLVFYRKTDGMINRSTDGGATWSCYSDDTVTAAQQEAGKVSALTFDVGQNKWFVNVDGIDYEAGIPGSGNWSATSTSDWYVHPADSQLVYRIEYNETASQNRLQRSLDGGSNWDYVFTYPWVYYANARTYITLTSNPDIVYASWFAIGSGSGIAASFDSGDTWTTLPRPPGYQLRGIYPCPDDPDRFVISSTGVGFWQGELVSTCEEVGENITGDITGLENQPDCYVDLLDFGMMSSQWLTCTDPAVADCDIYWIDDPNSTDPNSN